MKFGSYFFKFIFFNLNFFSLRLDLILSFLQIFNILENSIVEIVSYTIFELLISFILINIDDFSFNFFLLLGTQRNILRLFFKLILWNINQVRNISCWFSIFWCFSCSKAVALFFLTNSVSWFFLINSLSLLGLLSSFRLG